MAMNKIIPVILSGGSGSRLWPMSREQSPKQLLPLVSDRSMLEETLLRFKDPALFAPPLIVTSEALGFSVVEQLQASGLAGGTVVLEPVPRNTAPALAAAALLAVESDPDAVMLVVPSDHVIGDLPGFLGQVEKALPAALAGRLITFSITPTRAETGYGYIRRGAPLVARPNSFENEDHPGPFDVAAFVEKPDQERAARFLSSGEYFWNSGMFLFGAATFLAELERCAPAVLEAVRLSLEQRQGSRELVRLGAEAFASAAAISVDHAVMEHTARAATIPCDAGWTDVGSWGELWSIGDKDANGNVVVGDCLTDGAKNCYIRSEGRLVTALGVEDLVVVATDDAVLVIPRSRSQDIRQLVDRLRQAKRSEHIRHSKVQRPWGYYRSIENGDRFQVKRITVKPGGKLSLQKHYHRSEHWVVVSGAAKVTRDDLTQILGENESIYIPAGAVHRLENPGKVPLELIEVQSGCYLGEDDIVRIDDSYGRVAMAKEEKSGMTPL